MKQKTHTLSERYQVALRKGLRETSRHSSRRAVGLGPDAVTDGVGTLDLANMHGRALSALMPGIPGASRAASLQRAGAFFLGALAPIEMTRSAMVKSLADLKASNEELRQRSADLASSNAHLKKEIAQRRLVEKSLKSSQENYRRLLAEAQQMQRQLKHLSRQVLLAQEAERKEISRELHDEIVQTHTGINVQLATLKLESGASRKSFSKQISKTQRLVLKSVDIVHRFARDLRPVLLDDLGLIPALHAYLRAFTNSTGLHVSFSTFAGVEQMSNDKRTVLYRVAQAALVNVAQHSKATKATVSIKCLPEAALMEIRDDGKSFDAARALESRKEKRLGLIGMRERVEMVGGTFSVKSQPGYGTTISALLPFKRKLVL